MEQFDDKFTRLWFALPTNPDELDEAISILKGLCEECLLAKTNFRLEVHSAHHRNLQNPVPIQFAAGETS